MSKLYFKYGVMESGKSTLLLQVVYNYKRMGFNPLLIKPSIDTKGNRTIVSRLGINREVDILLSPEDKIITYIEETNKPSAIIVDEAQFMMPEQVDDLYFISKIYDIPVICYGLRCDFQLQGFPGATRLLEIADSIEEIKTICDCGTKATANMRIINEIPVFDGAQVAIDGEDEVSYVGVCGKCYLQKRYPEINPDKSSDQKSFALTMK